MQPTVRRHVLTEAGMEQRQEVREGTKGALRGFGNKSNMEGNAADEGLSLGLANFRTGSKEGMRHVWYNEGRRGGDSRQEACSTLSAAM